MAKRLKKLISTFFINLLTKWLEDIFIFVGVAIIIATTYSVNTLVGHYLLGAVFLLFGFLIAKK